MNAAFTFEPIGTLTSSDNLQRFIAMCRDELTIFGNTLNFDDNMWDISSSVEQKGSTKRTVAIFSSFEFATSNNKKVTIENLIPMRAPFIDFAKAYFRYRFGIKSFKAIGSILEPLRILEKALISIKRNSNPHEIDNFVLDEAVRLTKKHYQEARAYRIGGMLAKIGKFLSDKRLTKVSIDWGNPIRRPQDTTRVGKKADDKRNQKMPSAAGLEVLPEIFNTASSVHDKFTISVIALLLCAPNRINEVFILPYDCEVTRKDKEGNLQYGLRWFPAKGAAPMIKWIIPSMTDTAKESIKRIKKITHKAREVCKWYDAHPQKLYLEPKIEYLRNKTTLNTREASYILFGLDSKNNILENRPQKASVWINQNSVPFKKDGNKLIIQFKNLEKIILKKLPKRFPYLNEELSLKFSESLFVQMSNEYHSEKGTLIPIPNIINMSMINDALQGRGKILSLFERFRYIEQNGNPIKITSHQFRHYLNTLAQKGGLSQLDITKWSGRLDVQQNQAYDHVSADEMLEMVRKSIGDDNAMQGPLANIEEIKKKVVISRDEFSRLLVRTAHPTEYGICFHDYTMMPCTLHADCMNCTEHICMKGDTERTNRIIQLRDTTKMLLERAKNAQDEGTFGANRWVEHHNNALKVLNNTCTILDNKEIPNGTFIQLANLHVQSPIDQANNRRLENVQKKQTLQEAEDVNLSKMRNLLEDMGEI